MCLLKYLARYVNASLIAYHYDVQKNMISIILAQDMALFYLPSLRFIYEKHNHISYSYTCCKWATCINTRFLQMIHIILIVLFLPNDITLCKKGLETSM